MSVVSLCPREPAVSWLCVGSRRQRAKQRQRACACAAAFASSRGSSAAARGPSSKSLKNLPSIFCVPFIAPGSLPRPHNSAKMEVRSPNRPASLVSLF
jgi:hypothetical protein